MTVRWPPTALRDLESLHTHVSRDRPDAATGMVEEILAGIEALGQSPEIGRPGRLPNTRELVIRPYLVVYRQGREAVDLLAIIHGARRWPESL